MAVDIPVVIDIDKAFAEAAKRVPQAIAPMQKAVDEKTLEVAVEINKKGDVAEVLDFVGKSKKSMRELQYAIKSVKQQLDELYQKTGGNVDLTQGEGKALSEALIILEDIVTQRQSLSRAIEKNALDVQREIEAERQHQAAINMVTKSIDDLNVKLAAWRQDLNSADTSSSAFVKAAQYAGLLERELERVNSQARIIGMNTGSIDQLNAKLQEVNRKFNAMPADAREQLGARLLADYKAISKELEKEGRTLPQIIAEESRREQLRQKGIQSRRYENAILNTTVKTMRILQEQERILSDRLSRATIGSGKYKQLKADLEGVRAEIEKVNGKVSEATIPALDKADNRLANLFKRSIQLVALHSAMTFVRNIREVTSEFEMQRVALGGIIQDTEKANSLFNKIKAAAIRSPFEIKDLVTYTKQLSAYRVETEDLFRVTMQLADVSAGLGVDMNRLILAYGQVKAASVLRGQELRQFTEAGIPLVKLLADKFVELGRAGTTTADVFELISKRAVPFEMIAEIFDDMTQKGGMFYKMQEKQSETLLGQWNNLKDSLSIMYDEMGNTEVVHGAMTALINDVKFLFQNWRLISEAVKATVVQYGALKIASLWMPNLRRELGLAKKAQDALTRSTELSKYAMESGSKSALREAARLKTYSSLVKRASMETRLLHRAWLMLKAAMSGGGWIGLAVGVVTALSSALFSAYKESNRLNKELMKIGKEGETSINRSISNFKRLAYAAVNAADGSKEQTAAVAELKRTYSDIIPVQQLEAAALRDLQGNYESLTRAIREKISEQIREQKVSTIIDEYGKKITKKQSKASPFLEEYGLDKEQIRAVMDALQGAVEDGLISTESTVHDRIKLFEKTIQDLTGVVVDFDNGFRDLSGTWHDVSDLDKAENALNDLLDVYLGLNKQIRNVDDSMSGAIGTYGKFAKMSKDMGESLSNIEIDTAKFGKKGTFKYNQENIRQRVEVYWDYIQKAFEEVNRERAEKIDISSALLGDGKIDFDFINRAVEEAMKGGKNTHLDSFVNSIQDGYERLVPSDRIVNLVRAKVDEFANAYSVPMDTAQQYFKKADDTMEDYVKSLQDSEKALTSSVNQMELNNKEIENGTLGLKAYSQADIDATKNTLLFVQAIIEYFSQFKKDQKHDREAAYVQDPFIKQLQDRMRFMKDFKKGYDDLNRYMNKAGALGRESDIMLSRGLSLGISASDQKRAAEELSGWYTDMMNEAFEKAKKKGASGNLTTFLSQQITGSSNKAKALRDFQALLQSLWDAKTDLDTTQETQNFENAFKRMKDELKRSETVKKFYDDLLSMTGDSDLATTITVSVYGGIGQDFKERMQSQLNEAFASLGDDAKTPEMKAAIDSQDFGYILDNLSQFPKEWQDVLKDMAKESQNYSADIMKNFANLVAKYGSTAQKIATIKAKAENEIKKVEEALAKSLTDPSLTPEQKKALQDRAAEIIKAINAGKDLDVFKQSDEYIKFFSEINVMTAKQAATVRGGLREAYLKAFREGAISADELRKNLRAVDEQFRKLNESSTLFGAYLSGGIDAANKKLQENADTVQALAEKMKSGKGLNSQEQSYASKMLKLFGSEGTKGAKTYEQLIAAFSNNGGIEKAGEAFGKMGEGMSAMAANGAGVIAIVDAIIKAVNSTIVGIQQIIDQLNEVRAEDKKIGGWFRFLGDFNKYAYSGWEKLKSGDPIGAVTDVASSIISVFNNIKRVKVDKLNKKIEKQDDILHNLEKDYDALDKAIQKAFGSDYISTYNQQMKVMEAEAAAYREQARLERKKGKSADEKKAKGYEEEAEKLEQQMAEKRSQISEFVTDTDVTSAAKSFAKSWIDAYKQFASTTGAVKENFKEMIDSMVVNSLAARLIQDILKPIFKDIDDLAQEGGELSEQDIAKIAAETEVATGKIDTAMQALMQRLAAAGLNMRATGSNLSGISKDIAGASEESINGLAAGINTQNFYMSYMPAISASVDAILAAIGGSTGENTAAGRAMARAASADNQTGQTFGDETFRGQMQRIDENISEMRYMLKSVITPKSANTNTHAVATK